MPSVTGLEWTFDTVASSYEKIRPGYVEEVYQKILNYKPIDVNSKVVEVGSGAGQATEPFLKSGCQLTAVEYGKQFSELLKEKFGRYGGFSVVTSKFEDVDFAENTYDLVFSATAFHWVPEKIGYEKVFAMLKKGGAFARFRNHPFLDRSNTKLSKEIDALYDKYYNRYYDKKSKPIVEYSEEDAKDLAMVAERYGFSDIQYEMFHRDRKFSASEYIELLGTYSDHIAIEESVRKPFFAEIEDAINKYGGFVTIHDTIDLQLARKTSFPS